MLTFNDVYHAPLDKLKSAADDWSEMTTKLETLAEDARTTMAARAKDDYWRGVNAEVTKPFVDKTAKEFDDAAKAAKGIKLILADGYEAFKKAKDDLKKLMDTDAPAQGLVVTAHGRVEARYPLEKDQGARHDPDFSEMLRTQNNKIDAMQRRIDAVVETCDDADVATANALTANITADQHNFSAPKYDSLDAEEAQRAVDLAKKGRDLTHAELQQLNELLADNHSSREFSRTFYEGLGPEGSLKFFGQLATDTYDYSELDEERLKDVQALQRNLGLNLATATGPTGENDPWTQKWSEDMRRLGTERIPLIRNDMNPPFGYQLLGGIMRYGNYDPKFLNPIAEHVVQLHQKDPYMFADTKSMGGWQKNLFNPSGVNGSGYDPVVGMLEALGHSPEASKQFFSAEPTAYNEDGTVNTGADANLGKGKDGRPIESYLDYFASEEYESFPDIDGHDPDDAAKSMAYMPDALGHALESATLGYSWDSPDPNAVRDGTNSAIMEKVAEKYGQDPGLLKHQEALADSMGHMGAGYIDDINWALEENLEGSIFAPDKNPDAHAEFGRDNARGFLSALGQHPDAYASVTTAERIYTTSMLEATVGPDGRPDQGAARAAVGVGAEVQGMLDQSRADQVEAEGLKLHEEYEKAQQQRSAWVEFGTTTAIAAGVAFLPATAAVGAAAILVPLAVDTGSGALEQIAGQVIGDWSDGSIDEHKEKIEELTREEKTTVFRAGEHSAEAPMKYFRDKHGIDMNSEFGRDLRDSVDLGYAKGNDRENQQGNDPETG
ncbi:MULTISPECIES: hypothetical protein [unclassified Streptomyces]|uniref:hypothetical protein n=1 Tax=unclassified Streptomyces TaxID=2593676 RepID=UPI00081D4741|nr:MULTISPECIES: hypothetical protein [unclassified Streptomyces]MYZ36525.1 hypothetical protein [Streptomyces sp. SID4917]SCF84300.1 hypothetical protein GA0115259_103494 [Streptomyces sp. MnatMP-M17]